MVHCTVTVKRILFVSAEWFTTLVRWHLEYASSAWDPYRQKDINTLEQVQRRAARFVTNCRSRETGCVSKALQHLQWQTLQSRREAARLALFYKGKHNLAAIYTPIYYQQQINTNTRQYHPSKYIQPSARTDAYKYSYFPRTITDWNSLPSEILNSESLDSFKTAINVYVMEKHSNWEIHDFSYRSIRAEPHIKLDSMMVLLSLTILY